MPTRPKTPHCMGFAVRAAVARGCRDLNTRWVFPVFILLVVHIWRWLRRDRLKNALGRLPPQSLPSAQKGDKLEVSRSLTSPARFLESPLTPPPRPGFDDDSRMVLLDDDPRYFLGAEVGKAQRAALNGSREGGTNTFSFDPASTLVRPALRVAQGAQSDFYRGRATQDDAIVVNGFFCAEEDTRIYTSLVDEVSEAMERGFDMLKSPMYGHVVAQMCNYFSIDEAECNACLTFHATCGQPVRFASPNFDVERFHKPVVTATFGPASEMEFRQPLSTDAVRLSCVNGQLLFCGRDADRRWLHEVVSTVPEGQTGTISVRVLGSSQVVEEDEHGNVVPVPALSLLQDVTRETSRRPSMRIITASAAKCVRSVSHDDVIIVPEFFCREDSLELYYTLLKEMRESQARGDENTEWCSWHEGSHLLTKNPSRSQTYQRVLGELCDFFSVSPDSSGTRFNWYRDGSDWKPFHHDSAAFNVDRAKVQNCTVGISFGASREMAFRHATTGELLYFPQSNGTLFFFGRDVNIRWQHAINALPVDKQDGKGRISIILWGNCQGAIEEPGSPPMISDTRGAQGRVLCRDFQKGVCKFGNRCRFSHRSRGR